jgi:hypothetical protein
VLSAAASPSWAHSQVGKKTELGNKKPCADLILCYIPQARAYICVFCCWYWFGFVFVCLSWRGFVFVFVCLSWISLDVSNLLLALLNISLSLSLSLPQGHQTGESAGSVQRPHVPDQSDRFRQRMLVSFFPFFFIFSFL